MFRIDFKCVFAILLLANTTSLIGSDIAPSYVPPVFEPEILVEEPAITVEEDFVHITPEGDLCLTVLVTVNRPLIPGQPGAHVVFGDTSQNVLTGTTIMIDICYDGIPEPRPPTIVEVGPWVDIVDLPDVEDIEFHV